MLKLFSHIVYIFFWNTQQSIINAFNCYLPLCNMHPVLSQVIVIKAGIRLERPTSRNNPYLKRPSWTSVFGEDSSILKGLWLFLPIQKENCIRIFHVKGNLANSTDLLKFVVIDWSLEVIDLEKLRINTNVLSKSFFRIWQPTFFLFLFIWNTVFF